MTEHVHDLDIGVHIEIGDESADVYGECGCGYVIDIDEINRRLNATERLSAKVARRNGRILLLNAESLKAYGNQTQGYKDGNDMIVYANTLEGES